MTSTEDKPTKTADAGTDQLEDVKQLGLGAAIVSLGYVFWVVGGMEMVERFAFYDLARKAYCVIQTGERRFYGCFVFKKGVIPPDAA